jgi:hypothetical protein
MPSPAPKRRKTCKLRREDSSDDDVLYVGTSPGHKQQQKPQKKEVIQLDSSDGSRFSLSGLTSGGKHKQSFDDKTTIKVAREPRTKKRDRSYNEVEEVVDRRKDPPEYLTVARAGAKDTLHRSKWPPAGDDGLSNNLRRKSSQHDFHDPCTCIISMILNDTSPNTLPNTRCRTSQKHANRNSRQ